MPVTTVDVSVCWGPNCKKVSSFECVFKLVLWTLPGRKKELKYWHHSRKKNILQAWIRAPEGRLSSYVSLRGADNEHVCGGILINEYHVLTAAHCIEVATPNAKMIIGADATERNEQANPLQVGLQDKLKTYMNLKFRKHGYLNGICIKYEECTHLPEKGLAPLVSSYHLCLLTVIEEKSTKPTTVDYSADIFYHHSMNILCL